MAKKTEEKKDIVPAQKSEITNSALPDWLRKEMGDGPARGLEGADRTDIIYPRLVLCQGLTPAVADGKRKAGDIMDNLTAELLVEQGQRLEFIPITMSKSRMYLKPMDEGGGILCRSDDTRTARKGGVGELQDGSPTVDCEQCIHKEWGDGDDKPKCSLFYNVMGLLPQFGYRPFVWSGKATNVKVFRRFLSIAKVSGVHLYALKFHLFAVNQESKNFKFKNWDFEQAGFVNENEYKTGERVFKEMTGKTWSADVSDVDAAVEPF